METDRALTDGQGRRIAYLRLSVTDRCNLACQYCVPEQGRKWFPHDDILQFEEMIRLVRLLASKGLQKVRLTGGEPLVRKNLLCLIRSIKTIPGIREVALTTNGILLANQAEALKQAGLDRVNISLDTLKPEVFKSITGQNMLRDVFDGITGAKRAGLLPLKINVVPMAGINDTEIEALAELSFEEGVHVRFIEQMPIGINTRFNKPVTMALVRNRIESKWGGLIPTMPAALDGPARRFRIPGAKGEVGFIHAMSQHFCAACNRIRLTATGQIRPCLLDDTTVDVRSLIRSGCDDTAVLKLIQGALENKGSAHSPQPEVATHMVSIGG